MQQYKGPLREELVFINRHNTEMLGSYCRARRIGMLMILWTNGTQFYHVIDEHGYVVFVLNNIRRQKQSEKCELHSS